MTLRRFPFAFVLVLVTASLGCGTTIVEGADSNNDGGTGDAGTVDDTGAEAADSNDTSCSIGSDGCPCTDGGACDHGLTCQAGLCTDACQIGLEGCPCTQGGACDPGLMCEAGACVPASSGDGDGDSGDGDGDSFMCAMLGDGCTDKDPLACVCEDCEDDDFCSQDEDCICSDCADVDVCGGDNCNDNGACHPYFENCSCIDCAGHPLCG
jgi:hypothetical protein